VSAIPKPKASSVRWLDEVDYPESDGKPTADNTIQYRWIRRIEGNVSLLYRDREDVFVAGDLLWYPVEGFAEINSAPDVMVAIGRPKGDRRSYQQWKEDNVAPQIVFEILSHSNTYSEMIDKQFWYEEHGVREYYVYDPEKNVLVAHQRDNGWLRPVIVRTEYVSPLMGVRFVMTGPEMTIYHPNGRPFLTLLELEAEREREQRLRRDAEGRADEARQQADEARQQADAANLRSRRLADLSRKARRGEATAEELAELDRLEAEALG
jgi:Uma2 family endonuclease